MRIPKRRKHKFRRSGKEGWMELFDKSFLNFDEMFAIIAPIKGVDYLVKLKTYYN